jgi:hypothetical protein
MLSRLLDPAVKNGTLVPEFMAFSVAQRWNASPDDVLNKWTMVMVLDALQIQAAERRQGKLLQ